LSTSKIKNKKEMPRQRDLESLKQKLKRNALKNNRAEFIIDMVVVLFIFNTT
jgi:hypothetical protein